MRIVTIVGTHQRRRSHQTLHESVSPLRRFPLNWRGGDFRPGKIVKPERFEAGVISDGSPAAPIFRTREIEKEVRSRASPVCHRRCAVLLCARPRLLSGAARAWSTAPPTQAAVASDLGSCS